MPENQTPQTVAAPQGFMIVPIGVPVTNSEARRAELEGEDLLWVHSNRTDDRVVLSERDPKHPEGGWAFVGGAAPALVARTPAVEAKLRSGEMLEIPEPPDGPKKPLAFQPAPPYVATAQPGQPIPLGRKFDPDVVPPEAAKRLEAKKAEIGREVAVSSRTEVADRDQLANLARTQRKQQEDQEKRLEDARAKRE
jgi:hypothetical protein